MERIDPTAFDLTGREEQRQFQVETRRIIDRTKDIRLEPGIEFPFIKIIPKVGDHYWLVPEEKEMDIKKSLDEVSPGRLYKIVRNFKF